MNWRSMLRVAAVAAVSAMLPVVHAQDAPPRIAQAEVDAALNAQRAQDLLARAVAAYRQQGDAVFAAFNNHTDFVDHELYVYVVGTDGTMLASGGSSAALIGRKVVNLRDAFGTPFFYDMLEKAKTGDHGIVKYRWLNRVHHKVERKVAYFQKVGDRLLAVGYYIPRATPEQAGALLDKAAKAVKTAPKKAFAKFNDLNGGFVQDDLYVFAVDLDDGKFLAHGVSPHLVGTDAYALTDKNGTPIVRLMVNALNGSDHGELDYAWKNPVTRQIEEKHTGFRKVGHYLVAVGYYTR